MERPFAIAILAMGGQGGGVLADWIVALAEGQGWRVQSTYVAGVAQRTGATLYYIEMLPDTGRAPVFAQMPMPGDVDVVIAAEWVEAGRAILRGLVTPDRTTLIASTHRSLAIAEKEAPHRAIADSAAVVAAAGVAARRIIAFDMQALAAVEGSVISASLFGALAASGALPFPRQALEAVVRAGDRGVRESLAAFAAAASAVEAGTTPEPAPAAHPPRGTIPATSADPALAGLLSRIRNEIPETAHSLVFAAVARLTDYQDAAYAGDYLDRLKRVTALDSAAQQHALTLAAAKALAQAMAYDDPIRIADLKTRASRFARVRREVGADPDQIVAITEFMHPRMAEVLGSLPVGLADAIARRPSLLAFLNPLVDRGRRIRTDSLFGFLTLYAVAGLRRIRRRTQRHGVEMAHLEGWFERSLGLARGNYPLAVAALKARALVKGYSDTHARGLSKFDRVMAALPLLEARADGAEWLDRLVRAAGLDEAGMALDGALKTVASLETP